MPSRQIHQLQAGQTHQLQARAGQVLTVLSGSLLLQEPPRWGHENPSTLRRSLGTGQGHVVTQGGWLTLQAHSACRLSCSSP
jgi:hypothetical protein